MLYYFNVLRAQFLQNRDSNREEITVSDLSGQTLEQFVSALNSEFNADLSDPTKISQAWNEILHAPQLEQKFSKFFEF
jgi:hypothetical protein